MALADNLPRKKPDIALWLVIGGLGLFLIVAVVGIIAGFNILRSAMNRLPPPPLPEFSNQQFTPPPVSELPLSSPSASDEAIVTLREEIKSLRVQIDSLDVFEPQISPPNLDLDITVTPR